MPSVLLLFAHPALEKSRAHRRLVAELPALVAARPGQLTVHDLYEAYPDYDVDVAREQALLAAHDVVVLQCPFYWYSTPPLVKQWEDLVLEHGWAYGSQGDRLAGKRFVCVLTMGGGASAYQHGGYNRFTVRELLAPLEQTATLCRMTFLAPYVVHGTHRLDDAALAAEARRYRALVEALCDGRIGAGDAERDAPLLNPTLDRLLDGAAAEPVA